MTISRMATNITKRRKLMRPLTSAETDKLVMKLIPIIAPINYKISFLPMSDLIPEENSARWN